MFRPAHRTRSFVAVSLAAAVSCIAGSSSGSADSADATNGTLPAATIGVETTTDGGGDVVAFCAAGEVINDKTATITGPEQAVSVFTELDPTLDSMEASAPPAVADAAATFVSTARASVASGDFTPFEDGTVDALVAQFDAVCAVVGGRPR